MGKINASDKIMFENKKRRKYGNRINFYINHHLKDRLDIESTACKGELMPEEALSSFTVYDAYSAICASGIVTEVRK